MNVRTWSYLKCLGMATKRNDPNYAQVTGHIPKELSLKFRFACTAKGLDLSEGLEASISRWLEGFEVGGNQETSSDGAKYQTQINVLDLQKLADQLEIPSDRLLKAIKEIKLEVINGR